MLTKNFYRLLQKTFYRSQTIPNTMPKIYGGTESVSENTIEPMARTTFGTSDSSDYKACIGVTDNLTNETDLVGTNAYKYSNAGTGELDSVRSGVRQWVGTMMILGSGTTAPTKNDYKLESFIGTDVLKCTHYDFSIDENLGTDEAINVITKAWTFQNISASPVTVSEVGLVCLAVNDYQAPRVYLFYRDVLTSPVTIQPNGKYTFETNLTVK